jgi:hypothetical protein
MSRSPTQAIPSKEATEETSPSGIPSQREEEAWLSRNLARKISSQGGEERGVDAQIFHKWHPLSGRKMEFK